MRGIFRPLCIRYLLLSRCVLGAGFSVVFLDRREPRARRGFSSSWWAVPDAVSLSVDLGVVVYVPFPRWVAGNDGTGADVVDRFADGIGVIGRIRQHMIGSKAGHQFDSPGGIAGLTSGEDDTERSAQCVTGEVDLGG